MENRASKSTRFSDEAIDNFAALFDILKRIHIRLVQEGYTIENARIIPPVSDEE